MGICLVQGAQEFLGRECDPDVCSTITIDNGKRQEDRNRHVLSSREQQMRYMYGLQAWASGVKASPCWCASRCASSLFQHIVDMQGHPLRVSAAIPARADGAPQQAHPQSLNHNRNMQACPSGSLEGLHCRLLGEGRHTWPCPARDCSL